MKLIYTNRPLPIDYLFVHAMCHRSPLQTSCMHAVVYYPLSVMLSRVLISDENLSNTFRQDTTRLTMMMLLPKKRIHTADITAVSELQKIKEDSSLAPYIARSPTHFLFLLGSANSRNECVSPCRALYVLPSPDFSSSVHIGDDKPSPNCFRLNKCISGLALRPIRMRKADMCCSVGLGKYVQIHTFETVTSDMGGM